MAMSLKKGCPEKYSHPIVLNTFLYEVTVIATHFDGYFDILPQQGWLTWVKLNPAVLSG